MSLEYKFEDLSIRVCGAKVGIFDGDAYLERTAHGLFKIRNICLTHPEIAWLFCTGGTPLERSLFDALASELYKSEHARDVWAAHVESERADAA